MPLQRLYLADQRAIDLAGVAEGVFELVDLTKADYARMAEPVAQYDDMRLETTDASAIAIAERLGIAEMATLVRRHFTAVRPRHVEAFSLLPERLCARSTMTAQRRRGSTRRSPGHMGVRVQRGLRRSVSQARLDDPPRRVGGGIDHR